MKLWSGRFTKEIDSKVNDFNSSISFDARLYEEDIVGSIAHAKMLGKQGIIEQSESDKLVDGLTQLLKDIKEGTVSFSEDAEDIHMNIETILTERLGETGKRLHTARSRNDQVALDFRMYVIKKMKSIKAQLIDFQATLISMAKQHTEHIMPGYTHLQRAQPITLAHHLMAWWESVNRDVSRITDAVARMDEMPLGAGALAASTHPIDRNYVCELLGFKKITDNSLDSVSDRDFALESLSILSIVMVHLSRMSEEVIMWCSSEFGFATLDDAYSTGSSIMPQKKNPDIAELVRGKSGRVFGDLITLLTVMKGLPLAYNKDMQEDKECFFDAVDTVEMCLTVFPPMMQTLTFNTQKMYSATAKGFLNATDAADYLVKKGVSFREAYTIVGKMVAWCIENDKVFEELPIETLQQFSNIIEQDFYTAIDLRNCVAGRKVAGGPSPQTVAEAIKGHL